MSRVPRPPKRRFAVVTKRGAGCDGRADIAGERYRCGRRRRVVLIPRRWDQVLRDEFAGRRRLASPVLRGERAISRNTIAQGVPDRFGRPVVTMLVCFFVFAYEAAGAVERPAFPAPSVLGGTTNCKTRTRNRAAGSRKCACLSIKGAASPHAGRG